MPLDVLLLDIDGTLVDSNDAHAQAWLDVFRDAGFRPTFERVRMLIGKGGDKLLPEITGFRDDEPHGKELSQQRSRRFKERYLPHLRPFPGVRPLMDRVRALGVQLVVATSAKEDEAKALAKIAGIDDLLLAQTSSDDAEHSKPDPDIVVAALRRAKVSPERALMLGDTPYDVAAALRAKVDIVGVRSGGWGDEDLSGAIAIYDDAQALLESFDQSPIARRASG